MCGIAGVFVLNTDERCHISQDDSSRILNTIRHRGPDGSAGWWSPDRLCWLGNTRLAIVDVEGGHQPLSNEDETVWVTFNGQIYNHREIRKELEILGHTFKTNCDTEVLVHAYEQWGGNFVEKLRGMFAFAIYDVRNRKLFIARDRLGIKPLHWWCNGSAFVFGSEIKTILANPYVNRPEVEKNAIAQFITLRYVPSPLTMFKNIYKFKSAHYLELHPNSNQIIEPKKYWDVSFKPQNPIPTLEEALNETDRLLEESVQLWLMSDVPLGAQLSGGVDSSLVVAHMEMLRQKTGQGEKVKTFSIGFDIDEYSELPFAKQVAEKYNTEHHEIIVGYQDFVQAFVKVLWYHDEPVTEASSIPTYLLCKHAKEKVTVMMTGEGGDELFGGYPKCAVDLYSRYLNWMPPGIRKPFLKTLASLLPFSSRRLQVALNTLAISDTAERYTAWFSGIEWSNAKQYLKEDFFETVKSHSPVLRIAEELKNCDSNDMLAQMQYSDLHTWLVDNLLIKGDRMSMGAKVESRVPFLDHKFVEFAASLPSHYKVKGTKTKILLKKLAERYIPNEVIYRKKVGFAVPLSPWFMGSLQGFLKDTLLSEASLARGYFKPEAVTSLINSFLERKVDSWRGLWTLLSLELWHKLFVDDDGSESAMERLHEKFTEYKTK